jgi:hypothetical protein
MKKQKNNGWYLPEDKYRFWISLIVFILVSFGTSITYYMTDLFHRDVIISIVVWLIAVLITIECLYMWIIIGEKEEPSSKEKFNVLSNKGFAFGVSILLDAIVLAISIIIIEFIKYISKYTTQAFIVIFSVCLLSWMFYEWYWANKKYAIRQLGKNNVK